MKEDGFCKLDFKLALGLAAPHTWAASILPVLLGTALAAGMAGCFDGVLFLCALASCILMQSSVNTLNDYYDFVKKTDRQENSQNPWDAVLVYNHLNPRHVFELGAAFLAAAGGIGIIVVYRCGWVPLCIGMIGGLTIVLYSGGRHPVSYLPFGELLSGLVMGGMIPLAVYSMMTGELRPRILLYSGPLIIGIALIMLTNNVSDIERDREAGRKTLPVLLGRDRTVKLYRFVVVLWLLCIVMIVLLRFRTGCILLPLMAVCSVPVMKPFFCLPFTADTRYQAMPAIVKANVECGLFYTAMILFQAR